MKDLEELMHSYGLDPSNPDDLDEMIYRIGSHNDDPRVYDPDNLSEQLSDYVDIEDIDDDLQDELKQDLEDRPPD